METCLFYFALLLLVSNYCFSLTSAKSLFNLTTDEYALISFKNSITSDPNSILLKNWSIHTPICGWIGVSCGKKHNRVTALNVSGYDLQGTIAPHLGNLTFLRVLDISSNNFSVSLPSELSKLRRLQEINVAANSFTAEIPTWFGAFSKLQHMYLYNNTFSGRIPSSLFNISRLRTLDLSYNSLEENVPEEIGNLRFLEIVNFRRNKLTGSIPKALFNISSLVRVDLSNNSLSGKIPDNVCDNIPKLKRLHLFENQLFGEIPLSIYWCGELEQLSLSINRFSGNIPKEIGNLTMLQLISLWGNELNGSLPKELGNLNSLTDLVISDNLLTGSIPKELGNLTSLTDLVLENNLLTGELPDELSNLPLSVLSVSNNSLSGSIPPLIFNISTLQFLGLAFNQFSGTLPSNMGLSLFNLEVLDLQFNKLNGLIPSSINNASQLSILSLGMNSLCGIIPNFANLRLLTMLFLSKNNLSGSNSPTEELEFISSLANSQYLQAIIVTETPLIGVFPASIGNLSQSLEYFLIFITSVRGTISSAIGNLTNLIELDVSNNQLSGSIPTTIGKLKKVGRLSLSSNHLEGSIPIDLCQMSSLAELYLHDNVLEGPIPGCLGEIQSLREIQLNSNKLNSTIPSNFWNLTDLIHLNLSSNYLSGQISSHIGKLKVINQMDFSFNLFSGDIPSSIDGCQSLEYLNLSTNNIGGSIPQSLGNIRGLSALELSSNNLSGSIPESLQDLKLLEYLNVSYNRLEGEIPNRGAFANFTAQSFVHNSALCGAPRFEVPHCLDADVGSRSKSVARLMKYILPSLVSAMVLVSIVVLLLRRWKRIIVPLPIDTSSLGIAWRVTSYIELSQATNSFSETNLLGRGSFGSVFKGTLSEGLNIAAKVFNLELEGANKSFETESRILSTIRHRNLVRIIGCCTNMELKALILEFMPNGSLEKWLYSNNYFLDLIQRVEIAIDVASALEYLHHGNTSPIVHCDIKPSNVLLDEDMTARVADFGIAKLFEEGETMVQTRTLATIGYAAPEYGSEGKVSTGADVYSFGIMLLEMFTRKKPTDDMFDEEMSLKDWVSEALEANAMSQVVAPALLSEEDRHFAAKEKCVASVFDLAMKCLAISADERITMIEAAATLKKMKAKFATEVTTRRQQHAITIT